MLTLAILLVEAAGVPAGRAVGGHFRTGCRQHPAFWAAPHGSAHTRRLRIQRRPLPRPESAALGRDRRALKRLPQYSAQPSQGLDA